MGRQYGFKSFEVDASAFKPAVTAEELRLGNWLQSYTIFCFDIKEPAKKVCVRPFQVDLKVLQMIYEQPLLVTVEPIPLTTEILDKAGFTKHKNSNEFWSQWVLKNNWLVSQWIHDYPVAGFEEKGVCYWSEEYVPVESLHKLQNLYFALTGKELEINL